MIDAAGGGMMPVPEAAWPPDQCRCHWVSTDPGVPWVMAWRAPACLLHGDHTARDCGHGR